MKQCEADGTPSVSSVSRPSDAGGEGTEDTQTLEMAVVCPSCRPLSCPSPDASSPWHISGTRSVTYTSASKWPAALGRAGAPVETGQRRGAGAGEVLRETEVASMSAALNALALTRSLVRSARVSSVTLRQISATSSGHILY